MAAAAEAEDHQGEGEREWPAETGSELVDPAVGRACGDAPISGLDTPRSNRPATQERAAQDRQGEPLPPQQPERSGAEEEVGATAGQHVANPPVWQLVVPVVDVRDGPRGKLPVRAVLVGGAPQAHGLVLAVDRQHRNLLDLRRQPVVQLARRRTGQGVDVDQPTAVEHALQPLGEFSSPRGIGRSGATGTGRPRPSDRGWRRRGRRGQTPPVSRSQSPPAVVRPREASPRARLARPALSATAPGPGSSGRAAPPGRERASQGGEGRDHAPFHTRPGGDSNSAADSNAYA